AESALGNQMPEVLDRLRAAQERLDRGVILEMLEQVVGAVEPFVELAQQRAAADRERVLVGVDEHESGHPHRRVAEALDCATIAPAFSACSANQASNFARSTEYECG